MSYDKIISDSLRNIGSLIAEDIDRKGLTDTGQSKEFEIRFEGNKVQLLGVSYLPYLIYGRPPGKFPPVDVIKAYVERNGITMNINGRNLTVDQIVYVIGRSISENGSLIYRGQKEGINIDGILENSEKKLFEEIENEAVNDVKLRLKI